MAARGRTGQDVDLEAANNGQVWAVFGTAERGATEAGPDRMAVHLERHHEEPAAGWLWLHLDAVAPGASRRVRGIRWLPEEAEDTLLRPNRDLGISVDDGVVHGTLPGLERGQEGVEPEVVAWHFALRPDTLVTTRRRPVPGLFALKRSLNKAGGTAPEHPAEVVDRALLAFADEIRRMIAVLDLDLDRVEDALLSPEKERATAPLGGELGRTRRFATALRRAIGPLDRTIHDDELELPDWAADVLLERARPAVRSVMDDLLALQDRARSLQDELASRQAEETNRRLYLVSIMTTLMLPATFVTGFFGMNTGGMFLASGRHGTVAAGSVCLLFMAMTWVLLKRLKLL